MPAQKGARSKKSRGNPAVRRNVPTVAKRLDVFEDSEPAEALSKGRIVQREMSLNEEIVSNAE